MIRITKPVSGPKTLIVKGAFQKGKDCAEYDACPQDYRSGKKKLTKSKRSIYASKQVKNGLSEAHHNKCCYCEKIFLAAINLAVEHFRPKTGVRQSRKHKEERPGYYWLAYDWENLLLSCHDCNSTYKQTLFPLANPKRRARSHHGDTDAERSLLVNPTAQEPRDHIRFLNDAPEPVTNIGRVTIEVLQLRRPSLREDRLKKIAILRFYRDIAKLAAERPQDHELGQRARDFLMEAILPDAEFSSMAQDFLNDQPM